eukprot:1153601-Pelagomonas_calceolata.AAC.1
MASNDYEEWAVPIQDNDLKIAHTEPNGVPRSQVEDDSCQIAGLLPAWNIYFENIIMMTCLSVTHAYEHVIGNACCITTSVPHHSATRQNKAPLGAVPYAPIF